MELGDTYFLMEGAEKDFGKAVRGSSGMMRLEMDVLIEFLLVFLFCLRFF